MVLAGKLHIVVSYETGLLLYFFHNHLVVSCGVNALTCVCLCAELKYGRWTHFPLMLEDSVRFKQQTWYIYGILAFILTLIMYWKPRLVPLLLTDRTDLFSVYLKLDWVKVFHKWKRISLYPGKLYKIRIGYRKKTTTYSVGAITVLSKRRGYPDFLHLALKRFQKISYERSC
jgi:hypothetical protein